MGKITLYLRVDEEFIPYITNIRKWLSEEEDEINTNYRLGLINGICYRFKFENGYGASIIKHGGSYGFEEDLWEVAVLKNDDLCYDTPVTCDVEGYCNDKEVNRILKFLKDYDGNKEQEFEFRDN